MKLYIDWIGVLCCFIVGCLLIRYLIFKPNVWLFAANLIALVFCALYTFIRTANRTERINRKNGFLP